MDEIFKRCDHSEYRIQRTEHPDFHKFVVSKRAVGSREYFVTIPKVGQVHGSRFGSCTCGSHKKEGCPCNHMVAVVKSGAIPLMTNSGSYNFQRMLSFALIVPGRKSRRNRISMKTSITVRHGQRVGRRDVQRRMHESWESQITSNWQRRNAKRVLAEAIILAPDVIMGVIGEDTPRQQ